jgi:hypothetical protein
MFSIHLYILIRTMQEQHYGSRSITATKVIFERAKADFTADIKSLGVRLTACSSIGQIDISLHHCFSQAKYSHAIYTKFTDQLLATHRRFADDLGLAPQEIFPNLLATVWT